MITKLDLEKNRLDLAYRRNLQLMNIVLISILGAIFASAGWWILHPEKIRTYVFIIILLGILVYLFYRAIDSNLRGISEDIKKLI